MNRILVASLLAVGLFLGMLLLLEIGRRIGTRKLRRDPDGARAGTGVIEGAVFALLGLLIAFTFSGATSRFDARRALIIEETNDIGTAWLRLDLLPGKDQPEMRELFRQYLDSRLETYRKVPDMVAVQAELDRTASLQEAIWRRAVELGGRDDASPDAGKLLLPALNAMIDITTSRTMAAYHHPPAAIYAMLYGLALASALLAGYGMAGGASRNWLHAIGYPAVLAIAVYVILDIEFPRLGLIQVDKVDQALVELRESMDGR
jgi:hypothetical protein